MAAAILLAFFDRPEDQRLFLCAHPLERAQAPGLRRLDQFFDAADVQLRVEQRDRLWTDALQAQQVENGRREFEEQILMKSDRPRVRQLANLLRQILADTRQFLQLLLVHAGNRIGPCTDRVRGGAIRANLEDVLALDLEQVGDLREDPRDRVVIHA